MIHFKNMAIILSAIYKALSASNPGTGDKSLIYVLIALIAVAILAALFVISKTKKDK